MIYYADYVPKNERHFLDMLDQFRKARNKDDLMNLEMLWIFSPDVDRQDILVALGRVERERGWQ